MFPLMPRATKKVILSFTGLLIQAVNLKCVFPMQWHSLKMFFIWIWR